MPGRHKTPLLGWHPPAGLSAWVRAEAQRRGVPISVILNEAVEAHRKKISSQQEKREKRAAYEREREKRRWSDPAFREQQAAQRRQRYANDPEYRERRLERNRRSRAKDA